MFISCVKNESVQAQMKELPVMFAILKGNYKKYNDLDDWHQHDI